MSLPHHLPPFKPRERSFRATPSTPNLHNDPSHNPNPTRPIRARDRQRLRMQLFPFSLRRSALTQTQCAAIRLSRKPVLSLRRRVHQLEKLRVLQRDVFERVRGDTTDQMLTLCRLATSLHSITFKDPRPPPLDIFDGSCYSWNWKGIKLRFRGTSTRRFELDFYFTSFTSNHEHVAIHTTSCTQPSRSVEAT